MKQPATSNAFGAAATEGDAHALSAEENPSFHVIYTTWFTHVMRWLRAFGCAVSDREDVAQEVFLVVRRRLVDFDGQNIAGWLYRIAERQCRDHKRRAWYRHVLSRGAHVGIDDLASSGDQGAMTSLEDAERRRVLDDVLAKMTKLRRATFVLFEIEGYSGEEIANMQGVAVNTVWTRLHHARKEFFERAEEHRRQAGEVGGER